MPMPMRNGTDSSPRSWRLRSPSRASISSAPRLRRPARRIDRVHAIERHQAVAGELRIMSAARGDRLAHFVKKSIEDEEHVIGQLAFTEGGRAAQIDEDHGDEPLAAFEAAA